MNSDLISGFFTQERAQEQFFALLENMQEGFIALDGEWRFICVNTTACHHLKTDREQLIGRNYWELFPFSVGSQVEEEFRRAVAGERRDFEHFCKPLERWFLNRCFPAENGGIWVYCQDITERKQTEIELLKSKYLLSEVQRIARTGFFEYDAATGNIVWSDEVFHIFGLDPGLSSITYEIMMSRYIHPDDASMLNRVFTAALQNGAVYELEHRIIRSDGSVRWLFNRAHPYFDENGELLRYIGTTLDITESKQREAETYEQLRHAKYLLTEAQKIVHLGAFEYIAESLQTIWSEEEYHIYGIDPAEPSPDYQTMLVRCIHPDDSELLDKTFSSAMRERSVYEFEHRIVRPGGEVRWVRDLAHPYFNEQGKLLRYIGTTLDITERKHAELELSAQRQFLQRLADNGPGLVGYWSNDLHCLFANAKYAEWFGLSLEKMLNIHFRDFIGEDAYISLKTHIDAVLNGQPQYFERAVHKANGEKITCWVNYIPAISGDQIRGFFVYASDISEIKLAQEEKSRLEKLLQQSRKMESIGRLAGGVAHDLNNMLTVIMGMVELSRLFNDDPEAIQKNLEQIDIAAKHSAWITRQLLVFSRQGMVTPKPLDLNGFLVESKKTLLHLIGENIIINFNPTDELWLVKLDPNQLNQIVINLALNSRDAMPNGGMIWVQTDNLRVSEEQCLRNLDAFPGEYVRLTIRDNGAGMDPETLEQIFEPFFTTKEVGKGTGLGLATVYGIVTQNRGFIDVESIPDKGTTFTIHFPRFIGVAGADDELPDSVTGGHGTILLVEDNELVLDSTAKQLQSLGYGVIRSSTPQEAIDICLKKERRIDLILTDVIMPGMNGIEMAEQIHAARPGMKTLFMSGYSDSFFAGKNVEEKQMKMIEKPFSIGSLDAKIREVLGQHLL
ncbi:MAG: PAS domain-containing protein [Chlorobiaceae bacterium]|nr:PAS domain-containing protein [Chlorobiaceae bacterium]